MTTPTLSPDLLYLSRSDLIELGGSHSQPYVDAIIDGLAAHVRRDYVQPLKPYLRWPGADHIADRIIAMPCYLGGEQAIAGLKWIGSRQHNPARFGLERASAVVVLNDAQSNYPIAFMEGGLISGMRTAAITAVATRHLARGGFTDVAGIGCGPIARMQMQTLLEQFAGLRTVLADADLRKWMLAGCLTQAAAFALVNVFALYVTAHFPAADSTAGKIGLLHSLGWLATLLAGPLWGRLNDSGEPRRHFTLAAISCALSIGLLTVVDQIWLVALLRMVQGACYAALAQSMLLACSRQLPASAYGHVTGLSRSFMVVGQLLGPLLIMVLMPRLDHVNLVWPVAALFLAAGLLVHSGRHAALTPCKQN